MSSENLDDAIASVGVIGLGVMGSPISANIAKEGFEVSGYDILPQRIEILVTNGGKAAGSAKEVAEKAQVVLTSLPSLAAFEDVVWGRQGILSSGAEGLIVME